MKNIRKTFGLIRDDRNKIIATGIVNTISSIGLVATPFVIKLIIDFLVEATQTGVVDNSRVLFFLSIILVIRFVTSLMEYLQEKLADTLFINTMTRLREEVFKKAARLSIDYYEKNRVGEIVQRVSNSVYEFSQWLSMVSQELLWVTLSTFFGLIALWFIDPWAGLFSTILTPISIYIVFRKVKATRPIRTEANIILEKSQGQLSETVSHITTVRSFANENASVKNYTEIVRKLREIRLKQFGIEQKSNFWRRMLNGTAYVLSVGAISFGIANGRHTPGDIFLIIFYLQQIISSLNPIARFIIRTSEVDAATERLIELLEVRSTVRDKPGAIDLGKIKSLEFKNVTFRYPGKRRVVLDSISFELNVGESLALVGLSGAGKTTITKLLLRFYEPTSGQILINGKDVAKYKHESVRERLGVVMQDVALFNDTVEANLKFANPELALSKVKEAARTAHADVFIEKLPNKYKSLVGERGIKLSGGEKQRVAIARAILKNPELIILDEATSSLDSQSEKYVQDALRQLMSGKTAVIIAHRLSTVMRADQILVLENGKIVEKGRHQILLKKGGLYAKLFKLQSILT